MEVYVRKLYNNRYYIISGVPENHQNNTIFGEFNTRRQAIRYVVRNGYELIVRNRKSNEIPALAG